MEGLNYISGSNETNNHKTPSPLDKNAREAFIKTAELSLEALYRQLDSLREQGKFSLMSATQTKISEAERKLSELRNQTIH